jgi:hypothetical protein
MSWRCINKARIPLLWGALMMSALYQGCSHAEPQVQPQPRKMLQPTWYNESDSAQQGLNYKFRGVHSGQLVVDGFGQKGCVVMYDDKGQMFYQSGTLSIKNASIYDQGVFRIPVTLRVIWRIANDLQCVMDNQTRIFKGGTIVGDYTVPVASRIPNELLEDIRTNKGKFRLKIRVADDGPLIGWDIESRPDYDPNKKHLYNPPYHRMIGGDFNEKRKVYFKQTPKGLVHLDPEILEPGWYIDRKTGKKIQTDF